MEEIAELKSKIKVVEDQIQAVEDQIAAKDRNEEELKEEVKVSSGRARVRNERDLNYVREEKKALREEKKALREKEKALRDEQARKESTSLGAGRLSSLFGGVDQIYVPLQGWSNEGLTKRKAEGLLALRKATTKGFLMDVQASGVKVCYAPPRAGKTVQSQLIGAMAQEWTQVFGKVYYANLAQVKKNDEELTFEKVFERETGCKFDDASLSPESSPAKPKRLRKDPSGPSSGDGTGQGMKEDESEVDCPNTVPDHLQTLVILDEVQTTFDKDATKSHKLWNCIKSIAPADEHRNQLRVASNTRFWLAGSRGSNPLGGLDDGSPVEIPNDARVPLRNTAEGRGLMFSWEEFCDLFQLFCMKVGADAAKLSSLKMILAYITEGHIGAFCTLIDRIRSACPFENYTEEQWQKQLIEKLLMHQSLLDSLETNRGFPGRDMFATASNVEMEFIRVLLQGFGKVMATDLDGDELRHVGDKLVKAGWLMMEQQTMYMFPSPLHMEYFRKQLGYIRCDPTNVPDSLYQLLRDALSGMQSQDFLDTWTHSLHGRRHESLFQALLFRELRNRLPSTQSVSPAVGAAFGMEAYLDLLIWPAQKGIEILRDGMNLKEHAERWMPGNRYYDFVQSGLLTGWATIDIRNPGVREPYRPREDVIYVEFVDDWKSFKISQPGNSEKITLTA